MRKDNDPMGKAVADYFKNGEKGKERIIVYSPMFDDDEILVSTLYRSYKEMPSIEQRALKSSEGKILDVGACSGCHSLVLQEMNKNVTAIDISPLAVETMQKRGIKKAVLKDFWEIDEKYDTILMLMNGIGIVGKIENLPRFFSHLDKILSDNGKVFFDSSDLCYLYEDEEGFIELPEGDNYYGELTYKMQFKNIMGEEFPWLYIDIDTLRNVALKYGYSVEVIEDGEYYNYLAQIKKIR